MNEVSAALSAPPAALSARRQARALAAEAIAVAVSPSAAAAPPARPEEAPSGAAPPGAAPSLTAAPPEAAAKPAEPVEVVVTGTRTPESSQRATVRTRVVTAAEAERRGATNVGEALQGELGVQVNPSAYGALGNPSAIQIQGFDRDRVLVLEDGERVIGDVGGAIDLSSIPLTDVARVELVAGPTSSLYGTSAIGGVVNVISAAPAQPGWSGRARVEGRSRWGLLLQGSGAYRADDAWAGAEASLQRSDGVQLDLARASLALPERAQRLLGVRAGVELGRVSLRARARWIHDAEEGVEEQDGLPGLGTYLIDLPEVVDRVTLHLDETLDLGGGSNLRLSAGRQWALRTSTRDRRDSPVDEARDRTGVLESLEGIATLVEGERRTWVVGVRAEVEKLEQRLHRIDASLSGITEDDLPEVPETRLGSGAAYGQLAWKLTDELTVMPGVRGEAHLRYGGVLAPRLAAAYRPTEWAAIRASGGRGFRAPSAKEIGFSFDHSFLGYKVVGNPDLVPEQSWGVNGDVTLTPDERVTVRAGAFANWIHDLIDIYDLEPVASSDGVDTFAYRNIGEARTVGLELQATLKAAPWLRAEAGYAYLWTRDDTNERPLEGRPPHTVQAAIRADLPWSLELTTRYRVVTDAFVEEGIPRAPGFQTLDARLARPLWPSSQGYVGVKNLLDAHKDPTRRGDQRPAQRPDQRPIEGRVIYLGVVAELPWEDP